MVRWVPSLSCMCPWFKAWCFLLTGKSLTISLQLSDTFKSLTGVYFNRIHTASIELRQEPSFTQPSHLSEQPSQCKAKDPSIWVLRVWNGWRRLARLLTSTHSALGGQCSFSRINQIQHSIALPLQLSQKQWHNYTLIWSHLSLLNLDAFYFHILLRIQQLP